MSWSELEPVVRTAAPDVRDAVRLVADASDPRQRLDAVRALGTRLGPNTPGFALLLIQETTVAARRLGLDLVGRLRRPARAVRQAARRILPDRSLPLSSRLRATRALLRVYGNDVSRSTKLLRRFAAGLGRAHAIERFEKFAPKLRCPESAIAAVRDELLNRQRLRCPRCGVMRRRRRMAQHLWKQHRLLLDGRRARTTWQVLDDRMHDGIAMPALNDLHRTILQRGLNDEESLEQLLTGAGKRHESLCPHCFADVPLPEPPLPRPMELSLGRIAGGGFTVTIEERSARPHLRIESPGGVVFDGVEPGIRHTPFALYWAAAFVSGLTLLAACAMTPPWHVFTTAALLGEVCLLMTLAKRAAERVGDPLDRAVDHAWMQLVPRLSAGTAVSRLALTSVGRGNSAHRAAQLDRLMLEAASSEHGVHLAPLWWLHAADRSGAGDDPLQEITRRLRECFSGRVPLACAADLLAIAQAGLRSRAQRARLRVLACEAAFVEGLTVGDLTELGRVFPIVARMMGTDDTDHLARLRWVWDQHAARPWRQCGPASTVFELARYPMLGGQVLAAEPDVLLYQPVPPVGPREEPAAVTICGRGLAFRDALLRQMPEHIWVWNRPDWRGGGFELRLGVHRFAYEDDPSDLAERLRRWAEFALRDFLPRTEHVLRYRVSDNLATRLNSRRVNCANCGKQCVPIAGRVGEIR